MNILTSNRQDIITVDLSRIEHSVEMILETLGEGNREISLVIVDDATISDINREYLGRNHPH